MASITARDLGLALRDHLEGNQVHHYSGDGNQFGPSTDVHFVDVSERADCTLTQWATVFSSNFTVLK